MNFFTRRFLILIDILNILGVGTLVFDTRIGLYNDPPNEEAVRFIQAVEDMFICLGVLLLGFVEKNLLPYMDTPSFKKLSKSLDIQTEIGMMFIDKKIKELEEMANRDDQSQENQGEFLSVSLTQSYIQDNLCGNR